MGKGFGIAALVIAVIAIFIPFGIFLSCVAIVLAVIAGLSGDKVFAGATSLIVLVNTFMLSPAVWIWLNQGGSGLAWAFVIASLLPFGAMFLNSSGKIVRNRP